MTRTSQADAIVAGHHRVTMVMNNDDELKGMGTTVVVAAHPTGGSSVIRSGQRCLDRYSEDRPSIAA